MNTLTTPNLILNFPRPEDLSLIDEFELRNANHLQKWELINSTNNLQKLNNWIKECEEGKSARFLIKTKEDPTRIVGFCNFTQIFHGSFQACYLGYKIDHEYEGKGLMFEALEIAIKYVFEQLGLHRIMANYMPINERSAKLLHRLNFTIEGYAKNYLLINDNWEDHVLTALTAENYHLLKSVNL